MGNMQSEMQHIANQLAVLGPEEKKFLEAVYDGRVEQVVALLKSHPNVIYARTKDWHNAWHVAAAAGNLAMLDALHANGGRGTRKPLPGEPAMHSQRTKEGRETPLHLACAAGHLTAMQLLISVGANPTDGDRYGNTIVHYAALKGQIKMLELLLASSEAAVAAAAEGGQGSGRPGSAGHGPSESGTGKRTSGSGQGGAQGAGGDEVTNWAELRNEAGLQPLHFAVWAGRTDAAGVLLSYRADLLARSVSDSMGLVTCNGGSTPLHVAALRNDPLMVGYLLEMFVKAVSEGRPPKQDPRQVTDNYRYTAQSLAQNLHREAVIALLDPARKLPGLPEGGLAQAGALRRTGTMARGGAGAAPSSSALVPAAPAQVEDDGFDGFAALASSTGPSVSTSGAATSYSGTTAGATGSAAGGGGDRPPLPTPPRSGAAPVPVLAPPPPRAGKAAPLPIPTLAPPPSSASKPGGAAS